MKRFIQISSIVAASAAFLLGLSPSANGSTPLGASSVERPVHSAIQTQANSKHPGHSTFSGPVVKGQARIPAEALARRTNLQQRRQRFLETLRAHAPAGSFAAKPMDSASTVNFPGFQQADVLTPGNSSADPSNMSVMLTADVNQDGKPDIINVQLHGAVNVLLNPGADKLSTMALSSVNTSGGTSRRIEYATTADLNGDGYPDLITLDFNSTTVLIYLNLKDGTFGPATLQPMKFSSGGTFWDGGDIAIGDFNGDGKLDLVAYIMTYGYNADSRPGTFFELLTFPGKGDGGFAAPLPEQFTLLNSYGATMPGQVAVGDVNNDGNLDIVFMAGGWDAKDFQEMYVATLLGNGAGVFTHPPIDLPKNGPTAVGLADGAIVGGMKLADLDGDGNLDILFSNCEDRNLYFSTGNGDGSFGDSSTPITNLGYPTALGFADMDGDGKLDVIVYGDGYTQIYPGLGKGAFGQPDVQFASGLAGYVPGEPADFDGDGRLDIARTDPTTDYTAIFLQKNGAFHAAPVLAPPGETPSFLQVVATADFNGDGTPDVLALDYTAYWSGTQRHVPYPDIVIGLNDGKGNFTYKVAIDHEALYTMGAGYVDTGLLEPIVGDFNGDHIPDILLPGGSGGLFIALSTGPATYAAPTQIDIGRTTSCTYSRLDIGDINNDGKQDIVAAYPGDAYCYRGQATPSGVLSLVGKGDGTFATQFAAIGASAYLPRLIDFNGDGKLDLALSDATLEFAYDFFVIPGNGDGTFNVAAATRPLLSGTAVMSIIAGDYNLDGKQDLTVGTLFREDYPFHFLPGTTGVEILAGKGDFTFGDPQVYGFGGYAYDGAYADFNGDGKPDLALNVGYDFFQQSPILSSFGYMVNQGDGTFGSYQPSVTTAYDSGGFVFAGDFNSEGNLLVADFNGDGAPDVLSVLDYDEYYHYASQLYLNSGAIKFVLTANATTLYQDSPVTVTANLIPTVGTKTPSGKVNFYDNGALVSAVEASGGTAAYTDSNPSVGVHNYTANYAGDANFNAATASAAVNVTVNVLAPAFTLSAPAPTYLTLSAGSSGTLQLTLNSNATFSGDVTVACSGAPSLATCSVSPATATLAGSQSAKATVTVTTQAAATQKSAVEGLPGPFSNSLKGAVSIAALFTILWPGRTRRLRKMWMVLFIGSLAAFSIGIAGCGSSSTKQVPGTPAGTYTLTITATSGAISQTQKITLNVQ